MYDVDDLPLFRCIVHKCRPMSTARVWWRLLKSEVHRSSDPINPHRALTSHQVSASLSFLHILNVSLCVGTWMISLPNTVLILNMSMIKKEMIIVVAWKLWYLILHSMFLHLHFLTTWIVVPFYCLVEAFCVTHRLWPLVKETFLYSYHWSAATVGMGRKAFLLLLLPFLTSHISGLSGCFILDLAVDSEI